MGHKLFDLSGKVALVTGGAVGVGRACATALAIAGADVAIIGRNQQRAEKTCESLRNLGVRTFFVKCDVLERKQIDTMTDQVVQRFGRLDVAINNAGSGILRAARDVCQEEWDQMIDLNLGGVFWCAQAQAKYMAAQVPSGGKIINIASMYATVPEGNCAYNAAKAGVVHLTKTLASEWGAENINVNCISPGWMLTAGTFFGPELRSRMRQVTPLGSLMQYADIYGAVVFLASSASDFVTGHDLVVDGGHTVATYLEPYRRVVPPRTSPDDEERGMREDPDPR